MTRVFISYRRDDSADIAGRIYDHLEARFGRESLFMDVDTIPTGVDFREHVRRALEESGVMLVVIGPNWLSAVDRDGHRRLDHPEDVVRLEIEWALELGTTVIPVLVGGMTMPDSGDLPSEIAAIVYRNAALVRSGHDFRVDVDRLIRSVQECTVVEPERPKVDTRDGIVVGQCPQCRRMNPADRDFCGGCGEILQEPCFQCESDNGVWDKFCGFCGADLVTMLHAQRDRLQATQKQVDRLRRDARYPEAEEALAATSTLKHPRLKEFAVWAQELLPTVRAERQAEEKRAREVGTFEEATRGVQQPEDLLRALCRLDELLEQNPGYQPAQLLADELQQRVLDAAQSRTTEHRYHEAVRLLEQIPERRRHDAVGRLLDDAKSKAAEIDALVDRFKEGRRVRHVHVVLRDLHRLLELQPDHEGGRRVLEGLLKQVCEKARRAWQDEHDYAKAASFLEQVPKSLRTQELESMLEASRSAQAWCEQFESFVDDLQPTRTADEFRQRLSRLPSLFDAKPAEVEAPALVARLQVLVRTVVRETLSRRKHAAAVDMLEKVPRQWYSDEMQELLTIAAVGPAPGAPVGGETMRPEGVAGAAAEAAARAEAEDTRAEDATPRGSPVVSSVRDLLAKYTGGRRRKIVIGSVAAGIALLALLVLGIKSVLKTPEAEVAKPGAGAFADDKKVAATPDDGKPVEVEVEEGKQKLKASEEASETAPEQASIGPGEKKTAQVDSPPAQATLVLRVAPEGPAEVLVDEKQVATARSLFGKYNRELRTGQPFEVEVAEGKHTLTVRRPGFATKTEEFSLKPGEWKALRVQLEALPISATLLVEVSEPGASVSLDHGAREVTTPEDGRPVEIPVSEGEHVLQVEKRGFYPVDEDGQIHTGAQTCSIKPGERKTIRLELGYRCHVYAVDWNPDDSTPLIACAVSEGADNGQVALCDAATLRLVRSLGGHERAVTSVAWSPDGKWLATGDPGEIRLWRADGTPGPILDGHSTFSCPFAWRPDGEQLALGGSEGTVRLWQADGTPGPVLRDEGRSSVDSLAWSPDGKWLAALVLRQSSIDG